jgi:hypothetical protein
VGGGGDVFNVLTACLFNRADQLLQEQPERKELQCTIQELKGKYTICQSGRERKEKGRSGAKDTLEGNRWAGRT